MKSGSWGVTARRRDERRRAAALELVLAQGARVPLVGEMTVGRDPASTVVLSDPSVSRRHARISADGPWVEDAGSRAGTYVDGVRVTGRAPLRDGARLRLGDTELLVERPRAAAEAARTILVPAGVAPAQGVRVRPGYALKRLEAAEGSRRWVLRDLEGDTFLRFGDDDARLLEQLDGTRSAAELTGEAERRLGPSGPARLARLLADLGDRGLLEGVGTPQAAKAAQPWWRRALEPRERVVPGVGGLVERLYRAGGWVLLMRPVLVALALLAVAGVGVFAFLVAHRYGTPFVVASKFGLGGLVFLLGRSAVVAVHELAHGLVMASYGRRVERAGFKLLLVFPYAFVDTSQAWFEPRRRRIAISAAGPASDVVLGAVFSIACLLAAPGTVRDICLPARVRRLPRGLLQPQPVPRPRRLPHPRRPAARAEPAPPRAGVRGRLARAGALLRVRRRLVGDRGAVRRRDDAPVPPRVRRTGARVGRVDRDRRRLGRGLRAGRPGVPAGYRSPSRMMPRRIAAAAGSAWTSQSSRPVPTSWA